MRTRSQYSWRSVRRQPCHVVIRTFSIPTYPLGMTSMFAFGFGAPTPNARREEIPFGAGGNPHRFFQKQKASDGDCAIRSFNNAVGSERITKPMVIEEFEEEQIFFLRDPPNFVLSQARKQSCCQQHYWNVWPGESATRSQKCEWADHPDKSLIGFSSSRKDAFCWSR